MCGSNCVLYFLKYGFLLELGGQLGAEMPCWYGVGVVQLFSVQWIWQGRFALCGVPGNLPDAAIIGIYGNHGMVPFLFLAPLCVEEKLLGAGGNGGV